ncbi:hypothetical protein [Sneathiella chinensis]|nr:hypothetical protein [Sneathiella chinensis]
MKKDRMGLLFLSGLLLLLSACEEVSQEEFLAKVGNRTSPDAISEAVGKPDKIEQDGAMALWRYSTDRGDVCYAVTGQIALRMMC